MKRKKKNRLDLSTAISIASLVMTAASIVWIGGFRFSALIQQVEGLGQRMDRLEIRMDKLEDEMKNLRTDLHKMDLRATAMEQRKP